MVPAGSTSVVSRWEQDSFGKVVLRHPRSRYGRVDIPVSRKGQDNRVERRNGGDRIRRARILT